MKLEQQLLSNCLIGKRPTHPISESTGQYSNILYRNIFVLKLIIFKKNVNFIGIKYNYYETNNINKYVIKIKKARGRSGAAAHRQTVNATVVSSISTRRN